MILPLSPEFFSSPCPKSHDAPLLLPHASVDGSAHEYRGEKFISKGNAFIVHGGSEGIYSTVPGKTHEPSAIPASGDSYIRKKQVLVCKKEQKMKIFAAMVEEGKERKDGKPSVGPVYRNLISKTDYPPLDADVTTAWDLFSVSVKKYPGNKCLAHANLLMERWVLMFGKLTRKSMKKFC